MIKIDFEFPNNRGGTYRDALHLPDDHTFTNEEIEAMKKQCLENWIAFTSTPPTEEIPATDEE